MTTRLRFALLAAALAAAIPAYAADPDLSETMLVLDASGSMWGQIGGRPKIAIARDAVGSMLDGWAGGRLGLMAYGHNRKGDCKDIEILQPVGADTVAGIRRQVNALNPKGMTPITDSVRQAAGQLRYREHKATVILVSDGEETCDADPCALGAELEAAGVDFTAHVVGFDIKKGSKADQQLQCLASNTGGRYIQARDAAELNDALEQIAQAEPAPPAAPERTENLLPPAGCRLFATDDFTGDSVLVGEMGYDNEMPAGWDNRVRSIRCSARSGLYLYEDTGREGDYVMIGAGETSGLGAVGSSYIYIGTYGEEEDTLE